MDIIKEFKKNENINISKVDNYIDETEIIQLKQDLHNIRRIDDKKEIKQYLYLSIIKKYKENELVNIIGTNVYIDDCFEVEDYYKILEETFLIFEIKKYTSSSDGKLFAHLISNLSSKDIDIYNRIFRYLLDDRKELINLGITLFLEVISHYNDKIITNLNIEKQKVLICCRKITSIINIYIDNIIDLFWRISKIYKLAKDELSVFLDEIFFDYPYNCIEFIKDKEEDSFIKYLSEKINTFEEQNKIKSEIKDIQPSPSRLNIYGKRKHKLNKQINEQSTKYSVFFDLLRENTNTILYGKKYKSVIDHFDTKPNKMMVHSYSYSLPLEYIIDPIKYNDKNNEILYDRIEGNKI